MLLTKYSIVIYSR